MVQENFDGTSTSKRIFATIADTGQRFGLGHIAGILTHSKSQKIIQCGHDQIASYGALNQYSLAQVRAWVVELIDQEYIEKTGEQYPILRLKEKAKLVLDGKLVVTLSEPDPELAHQNLGSKSESVAQTLALYKQVRSIAEIAKERNLAQVTILGHLADAYQNGESLDIDQFVPASKQQVIVDAFRKLGTDYLSPVKQQLGLLYSWEELKLVRAKLLRSAPNGSGLRNEPVGV